MLLIGGDHVPDIGVEFVEIEGKVNAAPEHIAGICVNVGVIAEVTFKVTVSVITRPQEFVAVKVKTTFPVTPAATVKLGFKEFLSEKVPLPLSVQTTDCCPCAVPERAIVAPAQTLGAVPASTVNKGTGATQPLFT